MVNIYVGNLSFQLTEEELRNAFAEFGEVATVKLITDRFSGRPKGFGFVEMPNEAEADEAIAKLNGTELNGREVRVDKAKPKRD